VPGAPRRPPRGPLRGACRARSPHYARALAERPASELRVPLLKPLAPHLKPETRLLRQAAGRAQGRWWAAALP